MPSYPVDIGAVTDKGPRAHNEDSFWTPENNTPPLPERGTLLLVCDGVGGHAAGDVASAMAANLIPKYYYNDAPPFTDPQQRLKEAIERANLAIYQEAQKNANRQGMGSTVTAALIKDNQVYVANVGDSRTYRIRNGIAKQLSKDHSWVAEQVEAGLLSPADARTHRRKNIVTRSLGHQQAVMVDIFDPLPLDEGDSLLLCTDGLTGVVADDTLARLVTHQTPAWQNASQLARLAIQNKTRDNVTCVIAHIGKEQSAPPAPAAALPAAAPAAKKNRLPLIAGGIIALLLLAAALFYFLRPRTAPAKDGAPLAAAPISTARQVTAVTTSTVQTPAAPPAAMPAPTPPSIAALESAPPLTLTQHLSVTIENENITFEWTGTLAEGQFYNIYLQKADKQKPVVFKANTNSYTTTLPSGEYTWFVGVKDETDAFVTRSDEGRFKVVGGDLPTATPTLPPTASAGTPAPTPPLAPPVADTTLIDVNEANPEAVFKWSYPGDLPPGYGFEVRAWYANETPRGVHDAAADNKNGKVQPLGDGQYQLTVENIGNTTPIGGRTAEFHWAVYTVQIEPQYSDLGLRYKSNEGTLKYSPAGGRDKPPGGEDAPPGGIDKPPTSVSG